ncbi:hypothetical protein FVEG_06900 [Fusarium verticillioides 7600]|uniref:Murein transglycosylase n=1 Tax=Gibberella moniliformis (strain M3125 / FGSC 7600) TaxID=334819 RepID=W7M5V2_GIBM7|nr:hypothetical protein FVEG_06900 [Fusarium verticillioides 7600]EWG46381.1 hypothetical protein FVEG_06900 [Fusarium verticillioides 7600]
MLKAAFITALVALTTSASAWLPNTEPHAMNERDNEIFVYPLRTDPNNKRWLPATKKIRGVNLGSLFIYEPWIDSQEWANTGCEGEKSEFDCVMNKGQDVADKNFQAHWKRWINQTDLDEMLSYGLNTIRVPLGYWLKEDVDNSEHFPKAIRNVEDKLKVTSKDRLHIQMMGSLWGSGKPTEFLGDTSFTAFDDHRYLKWDTSVEVSHGAYIKKSCSDDRNTDGPTIVGEWSLAVPDDVEKTDAWNPQTQKEFYTKWFSAQVHAYEKHTLGWVFWTWKANLGDDYRWSYRGEL